MVRWHSTLRTLFQSASFRESYFSTVFTGPRAQLSSPTTSQSPIPSAIPHLSGSLEHTMAAHVEQVMSSQPKEDSDSLSQSTKRHSDLYFASMPTKPAMAHSSKPMLSDTVEETSSELDIKAKGEEKVTVQGIWMPTKNEWLIMISLAFISLMTALDATILVTVLPVSIASCTVKGFNTNL